MDMSAAAAAAAGSQGLISDGGEMSCAVPVFSIGNAALVRSRQVNFGVPWGFCALGGRPRLGDTAIALKAVEEEEVDCARGQRPAAVFR